jgi:hypothetical protein
VTRGGLGRLAERGYAPPYKFAVIHVGLGEAAAAFSLLERAYAARDDRLVLLDVDPLLDPLRGDPRFADLRSAGDAARERLARIAGQTSRRVGVGPRLAGSRDAAVPSGRCQCARCARNGAASRAANPLSSGRV